MRLTLKGCLARPVWRFHSHDTTEIDQAVAVEQVVRVSDPFVCMVGLTDHGVVDRFGEGSEGCLSLTGGRGEQVSYADSGYQTRLECSADP